MSRLFSPYTLAACIPLPESTITSPDPDATPPHHSRYYFDDEMTIFLVENRLFKVHRHFLMRESEVFRSMFACPPGEDGPGGGTDEKAILLPYVTCEEFENLLDFFYTGMHRKPASPNDLVKLLSISTRFAFEQVRHRAIDDLDVPGVLDPIEKIVLAEKYNIPQWLAPAYAALCQRHDPLDEEEGEKIGIKKAVLVARAREELREFCRHTNHPFKRQGMHECYSPSQVENIVRMVFFPPRPASPASSLADSDHSILY